MVSSYCVGKEYSRGKEEAGKTSSLAIAIEAASCLFHSKISLLTFWGQRGRYLLTPRKTRVGKGPVDWDILVREHNKGIFFICGPFHLQKVRKTGLILKNCDSERSDLTGDM